MKGKKIKFTLDSVKEVKKQKLANISFSFSFTQTEERNSTTMKLTGKIVHNLTNSRFKETNIKAIYSFTFNMGEEKHVSKNSSTVSISNNYNVKSKPEDKPEKPKDDED